MAIRNLIRRKLRFPYQKYVFPDNTGSSHAPFPSKPEAFHLELNFCDGRHIVYQHRLFCLLQNSSNMAKLHLQPASPAELNKRETAVPFVSGFRQRCWVFIPLSSLISFFSFFVCHSRHHPFFSSPCLNQLNISGNYLGFSILQTKRFAAYIDVAVTIAVAHDVTTAAEPLSTLASGTRSTSDLIAEVLLPRT